MPDNDAGRTVSGRTEQTQQLLALFESARSRIPTVAIVSGSQGMGKTSFVEHFLDLDTVSDAGAIVLRAGGALWEQDIDFGVLDQLLACAPRSPRGHRLAEAAGAPGAANAMPEAPTSDTPTSDIPDAAKRETLMDSLRQLGERAPGQPVVVWIDDVHWSDVRSLKGLLYVLRRLGEAPLLVVLGVDPLRNNLGPGADAPLGFPGAGHVELRPLTAAQVRDLYRVEELSRGPLGTELQPSAARALVEHTGGNPGYVLDLLAEFPGTTWSGVAHELPAPAGLEASVAAAMQHLPAEAFALAEAAAVLGTRAPLASIVELGRITDPVAAVDSAHTAGLLRLEVTVAETLVVFAVPVIRAAVYRHLGPARRAYLHARAAMILTVPLDQLHHRAMAALLPDASLSRELESAAAALAAQGSWGRAADNYSQAARLSPVPTERGELLVKAVDAMVGAGQLPRAIAASDSLGSLPPSPLRDAVGGYLAILRGRPSQADALLHKAWTAVVPSSDPETAGRICQRQVLHALARFNGRDLVSWADRAVSLAPAGSPPAVESQAILGLGLGVMGRSAEAVSSYESVDKLPEFSAQHQRIAIGKGWLYMAMDRLEEARSMLASAVPTEFGQGSQRISLWAQGWLARVDVAMGAWDDALLTVERGVAMQEESGMELLRPLLHWTGAQIHALRGNQEAAEHHLERGAAATDSYPTMLIPHCLAQAQVAESRADYDGVIRALMPVLRMPRNSGIDEPGFWPWQDHYANALVMVGRIEEADAFMQPHERLAAERHHRSTLARLSYVRGRIHAGHGDLDAARESFLGGLAQLEELPMPFARARVKFAYGQSFRRAGKRKEAAAALSEARDLFAVIGAEAYVDRCLRELRAAGVSPAVLRQQDTGWARDTVAAAPVPADILTEQEKTVAALVASGLSNKEAAAELYVSVKTVQYHLTRIYTKLGISSRSELAAVYPARG